MFRSIVESVARNTSILTFQYVFTMTSSFLLLLFLPRYLGPVDYGRYYLAISITAIFQIVVNYGSNYLIAKRVAREKEGTGQILVDSIAVRIILAITSIAVILLIGYVLQYPKPTISVLTIFSLGLILWAISTSFFAVYQGHELLQFTSIGAVAERLYISVVGISALLLGADAFVMAVVVLTGGILNVLLLVNFSRRVVTEFPKIQWKRAIKQISEGLPYFLFGIFSMVYYRIGAVVLSKMAEEETVGHFGGAFRLFESLNFPYFLSVAVYPILARLWKDEADTHRRTTQKSLELVVLGGIPVSLIAAVFAKNIIDLFYGLHDYGSSVLVLQVLCGGLLFLYVDMVLGTTLVASDRQRQLMWLALSAIPINVALNYTLIDLAERTMQNGAAGSALATGLTELLIMVVALRLLPKGVLRGFRIGVIFRGLLSGSVMILVLMLLDGTTLHWILKSVIALAVYAVVLWNIAVFEPQEKQFIKEWVGARTGSMMRRIGRFRNRNRPSQ